jgi:hypothetical protein
MTDNSVPTFSTAAAAWFEDHKRYIKPNTAGSYADALGHLNCFFVTSRSPTPGRSMLSSAGSWTGLGRSLKHLVTTEDLSAYCVAFISLRDNLDLSTPSGRLMMHIIGAMAQIERELIEERVSAGMHAARKRDGRIGRPQTLRASG